jgi:hypothetical protein
MKIEGQRNPLAEFLERNYNQRLRQSRDQGNNNDDNNNNNNNNKKDNKNKNKLTLDMLPRPGGGSRIKTYIKGSNGY